MVDHVDHIPLIIEDHFTRCRLEDAVLFVVACKADILQQVLVERYLWISDILCVQLDPVMDDIAEAIVAALTKSAVDPNAPADIILANGEPSASCIKSFSKIFHCFIIKRFLGSLG